MRLLRGDGEDGDATASMQSGSIASVAYHEQVPQGAVCRVQGLGDGDWGFRVVGCRAWGQVFRAWGVGFRVQGLRVGD